MIEKVCVGERERLRMSVCKRGESASMFLRIRTGVFVRERESINVRVYVRECKSMKKLSRLKRTLR